MPAKLILIDAATGKALATKDAGAFGTILLTSTPLMVNGVFKTTKITAGGGTGSTTVAIPKGNGSLVLTDVVVSFEKKTAAEVTLQFNDGTNTELIWFGDLQDAPISFAIAFTGKWQGWQSAYLEIVVAGAGLDGSIGVGYVKMNKYNSLTYSDWNKRR
jgi:hypothetical protein